MYAFILKNCLLPHKLEYFTKEKDCYVRQINPLGEQSNIREIIDFLISENQITFKSEESIQNYVNDESQKFKFACPCAIDVVNRKYDYEFIENTILILSYFQKFPAELYCVYGIENGVHGFEFYPDHSFPSYKPIFPDKFYDFYIMFNEHIGKYKYVLKLFLEANREKEVGYKITKYYSILETLAGGVGYPKVRAYLQEKEHNQPLKPDEYTVDMTLYQGKLYDKIVNKGSYSYLELMAAYRHLVVHFGELNPSSIKRCFESNQDMIFLLQAVVENLIRQSILEAVNGEES